MIIAVECNKGLFLSDTGKVLAFLSIGTCRCLWAALVQHVSGIPPLAFSHAAAPARDMGDGFLDAHGPAWAATRLLSVALLCPVASISHCW